MTDSKQDSAGVNTYGRHIRPPWLFSVYSGNDRDEKGRVVLGNGKAWMIH